MQPTMKFIKSTLVQFDCHDLLSYAMCFYASEIACCRFCTCGLFVSCSCMLLSERNASAQLPLQASFTYKREDRRNSHDFCADEFRCCRCQLTKDIGFVFAATAQND
jgi:hypothetical protein